MIIYCYSMLGIVNVQSGYAEYSEMYNFAAQYGVYEVRNSQDHQHGKVCRQVVLQYPVPWACGRNLDPTINMGGNSDWYGSCFIHCCFLIKAL